MEDKVTTIVVNTDNTCYICKKPLGLKVYKRNIYSNKNTMIVSVCSKKCRDKQLKVFGQCKRVI